MRFFFFFLILLSNIAPSWGEKVEITEEQISECKVNSDCIIVPYTHCCGSTKRAIHKKYESLYHSKKEWQKFDDVGSCSVMGICLSDQDIKEAYCGESNKKSACQLKK